MHLAHTIKGSKSGRWLCKIDLQNCYWSIKLPRSWHKVSVVQAGRHRYKYTRLPFGWRYSPSICPTLVKRLVASAPVGNKVYLDDVQLDAKSRRSLNRGTKAVVHKLRQAGFILSVKSETRPTKRIGFVGKWFHTLRKYIQNQPALLARAFRMWIRVVGTGKIAASDLMRLLGRMQWLIRPASLSCFLAGAYRSAYSGEDRFTRGLIRSTTTALVFSMVPQSCKSKPAQDGRVYFGDAAPPSAHCARHTIGVVGPKGCYRLRRCPPWVPTLAQAELCGLYTAAKIAAYEGHGIACIGVDSDTARYQALRQRAMTHCRAQNRFLHWLFWLRLWSGLKLVIFMVHTSQNPADPLSRQSSFPSVAAAIKDAQAHQTHWCAADQPYEQIQSLQPLLWSLHVYPPVSSALPSRTPLVLVSKAGWRPGGQRHPRFLLHPHSRPGASSLLSASPTIVHMVALS